MPGKHYNGSPKKGFDFKSEKPKNKKNYNSKSAEQISEEVTMSAFDKYKTKKEPINKGIGNYKGSGNFAMKNKVLAKSARYGGPMQKNFLGKVGKAMMGPAGMLLAKKPGSTQEKDENKKSTDTVVNPDTKVVTDVATQRLIKAGAPKEVIEKAKAEFIAREKAKKEKKKSPQNKKSPLEAGQTAGQIVRRERLMT